MCIFAAGLAPALFNIYYLLTNCVSLDISYGISYGKRALSVYLFTLFAVAESVECRRSVWEGESLNPCRVNLTTYTIDSCFYAALCFALLRMGKDWLAQDQDNVTKLEVGS